jgi:hypothetical protein
LIFTWILASSVLTNTIARAVFGVRISYQANGNLLSFMVCLDNGRTKTLYKVLSKDEFVQFASGNWPSIYNPKRINLFEDNELSCGIITDSFSKKQSTFCFPADSLWKLRYASYPFRNSTEEGWSNNQMKPSPKQQLFLYHTYGVKNIDGEFFMDTSFWKLLRDVQNTQWISNYKSLN